MSMNFQAFGRALHYTLHAAPCYSVASLFIDCVILSHWQDKLHMLNLSRSLFVRSAWKIYIYIWRGRERIKWWQFCDLWWSFGTLPSLLLSPLYYSFRSKHDDSVCSNLSLCSLNLHIVFVRLKIMWTKWK